jgi:AcrR family transcriptional regulator
MNEEFDHSTQQRILKAAKKVFLSKGFAGTKTRDIATEANINLAMLHYYFRSKENLFEVVMMDTLTNFIEVIKDVLNDPDTDFKAKLELIVSNYIDKFLAEPQLPLFVISQLHNFPESLARATEKLDGLTDSVFFQQYQAGLSNGRFITENFTHFLMNIGGLIVFPFLISPALKKITKLNDKQFSGLMADRKKMVINWLKQMSIK